MSFSLNNLNNAIINPFKVDVNVGQKPAVKPQAFAAAKTSELSQIAAIKPKKLDTSSYSMAGFNASGFNGYSATNIEHAAGLGGTVNQVRTLGIG